ncbi:hypothetical protein NADFUDRAFT_44427 [Nadsonia fulvescens var. elongata DSM 6958]|uniref:Uncharacterized protein n=1 Tax=Nadsonia fulvescens var. elongata DSM 6958 TaxID=857566 RepID=A0A1E3PCK5_9ASCO|nr:hypothetical protein NADFUDRAFT_44427 [Nadsonia fulvescens var. elongata DSM 6958]
MDSEKPSKPTVGLKSPLGDRRDDRCLNTSPLSYHVDTSFDNIIKSPGWRSPVKAPTHSSPLPPLPQGSDLIMVKKRRRLTMDTLEPALTLTEALPLSSSSSAVGASPSAAITDDGNRLITPSKPKVEPIQRRTPSLNDRPIPILPPVEHPLAEPREPQEEKEEEEEEEEEKEISLQDLKYQESQLDAQLRQWKRLVQLSTQAYKYELKNEDDQLKELILKWRDAAQQAANYLLNQASERINRMGGFDEYQRRQKDRAARQSDTSYDFDSSFTDTSFMGDGSIIDIEELSPDQREAYDQMKAEREQQISEEIERRQKEAEIAKDKHCESPDEEDLKEISMGYMLKQLNVDPLLLFPEGLQ